jgi:hypothetical protein
MQKDELDAEVAAILALMANWDDASVAERRRRFHQIKEHQRTLWEAYGDCRGWSRTAEPFPVRALASVSAAGQEWKREFTDHHSFWTKAGRPAAVAAHLYSCGRELRTSASIWAARHGLQAAFPTDFPSWWNPGRTTLIEITRAN